MRAIAGEARVAPHGATFEDGYRAAEVCDAILRSAEQRAEREDPLPMKTSLGIWALGPMVTRFVPGGYQPERHDEPMPEKVHRAVERPRRPDGRLRVPLPGRAQPRQPRRGAERARRPRHLRDRRRPPRRPALPAGGLTNLDDAVRNEALRILLEAADLAGDVGAQMIVWPGGEGYNYPFQVPYAEVVGAPDRRRRAGRGAARRARRACSSSSTRTPSRR